MSTSVVVGVLGENVMLQNQSAWSFVPVTLLLLKWVCFTVVATVLLVVAEYQHVSDLSVPSSRVKAAIEVCFLAL